MTLGTQALRHDRRWCVGFRRSESRRVPQHLEVESEPGTYIISDAELVEFERSVYEIDAACGEESGRYEAERDIARRVIDTIRAETGYDGVDLEPAT